MAFSVLQRVLLLMVAWLLAPLSSTASTIELAAYTPVTLPIHLRYAAPDKVLVEKSTRKLYLLNDGNVIKEYPVAFGKNPVGHKQEEGDGRTPEGSYTLDWRKKDSKFYRAIHISYPNEHDVAQAEARDVEPGGSIMIHGSPAWVPSVEWAKNWLHQENWTEGCIAVTNDVMDEIWQLVKDGTPIEIRP